jgi:hypothetical protein
MLRNGGIHAGKHSAGSSPMPKRQSRIKQQVDVHSLALEVQTLSLVLSDLRRRLSELERKSNTDKITDADRGLLKNLDTMFGKPSPPQ